MWKFLIRSAPTALGNINSTYYNYCSCGRQKIAAVQYSNIYDVHIFVSRVFNMFQLPHMYDLQGAVGADQLKHALETCAFRGTSCYTCQEDQYATLYLYNMFVCVSYAF